MPSRIHRTPGHPKSNTPVNGFYKEILPLVQHIFVIYRNRPTIVPHVKCVRTSLYVRNGLVCCLKMARRWFTATPIP